MSDEPTNIVRRPKAAAKPEPMGRGLAGTIRFSCSNGHPIVVPAKLAGKRGACSRCGVAVVIPLTSDKNHGAASAAGPGDVPGAEPSPAPAAAAEPGVPVESSPGVPEPAVETMSETAEEPVHADDFAGLGGDGDAPAKEATPAAFEELAAAMSGPGTSAFGGIESGATPEMDGVDNPTAVLVAKLFGETEHGGVVELHLKSGQIVMPLLYDFNWSRGTHGVFAAENKADNTITLLAVSWDSVEQVIIRKVKGLPDGMFE